MTLLQFSVLLRMMIAMSLVSGLVGCSSASAQETVSVTEITPDVLVFVTTAGNVVASVGPDGALLVGTPAASTPHISDVLASRTESSVRSPLHVFTKPMGAYTLRWSPDGKGFQYLLTRKGASNVWEQPLSGGPPRRVTNFTSGVIFDFAWSREGENLLLAKGDVTSDVILISNFR